MTLLHFVPYDIKLKNLCESVPFPSLYEQKFQNSASHCFPPRMEYSDQGEAKDNSPHLMAASCRASRTIYADLFLAFWGGVFPCLYVFGDHH